MHTKIRDYVGIAIIIGILAVGYAAVQFVGTYAASIQPTSFRSFTVTGDGKAVGVPDVATLTASVITEGGTDIATLESQNTDKGNKIIAFLKGNGVDPKDIQTSGYDLQPRYQYSNCGYRPDVTTTCPPPQIIGYTITQSIAIKVRDFTKIGAIVGGVTQNGANSVSQLTFKIDDPTQVQSQARAQAIAKAKASAEAVANAGGFAVGRLLSIEENANTPFPLYYTSKAADSAGGIAPATPTIEAGSQEVTVTVTLRYEIR